MATQLKEADYPPIPVSAFEAYRGYRPGRPNIRVAFSAGCATLAMRDKLAEMPDANRTLDEIARDATPLRELLAERNAVMTRLNEGEPCSDEQMAELSGIINRLENAIFEAPASSADDATVKLIAAVQVAAEGHELDDVEAARVLVAARRQFGIGYAHYQLVPSAEPVKAILPDGYDPYMRGPYIAWTKLYDRFVVARAEQRTFYDAEVRPAACRFMAVREAWPDTHDFTNDPVGSAAIAAVDYSDIEERYDGLVSIEHQALVALLKAVAPSPRELATKLKLVHSEEVYTFIDASIFKVLAEDARRFGQHGAFVETDAALLAAFAKRRAEAEYWLQPDAIGSEEIETRSNAIVHEAEQVIFGARASTIEGVVAKLRALYPHIAQYPYSERASVDPSHPEFRAGLREDGPNEQVLWSCIEDLARIGGIQLAEQGR